jgi:putative toxin-antitoxin system antitoxin component (TIGR02293 family)
MSPSDTSLENQERVMKAFISEWLEEHGGAEGLMQELVPKTREKHLRALCTADGPPLITANQVKQTIGANAIKDLAGKIGLTVHDLAVKLAEIIPGVIEIENTNEPSGVGHAFAGVVELLGGHRVIRKAVTNEEQAHDVIYAGLPARAMIELTRKLPNTDVHVIHEVIGISERSFARRKTHLNEPLSLTESSNVWRLAQFMEQAIRVFGEHDAAERWFSQPALALNSRRPIDLLKTPPGTQAVKDLLTRMEYGVYT